MRIVIGVASFFVAASAMACSWKERPISEVLAEAKSVFRARVTEVKLVNSGPVPQTARPKPIPVVEARYELLETFKGEPPPSGVVRDFMLAPGNCSLGLFPGWEYIFIPGKDDMVILPTGSFGYFNPDGETVKPRIEEIRKLSETKQ